MQTRIGRNVLFLVAGTIISAFVSAFSAGAQSLAEALDTTNLVWTTGGDTVWFAQTTNTYDGVDAVQSGSVYSGQTSWLETTVVGPATISFWSFSHLNLPNLYPFTWNFTVNGVRPASVFLHMSSSWNEQIYDLGKGTNVLRWTTYGLSAGSEASFVCLDEFTVSPPRPLAILYQPQGSANYSGSGFAVGVTAIGTPPLQYQWRKNGTNIDNATNTWLSFDQATTNDTGIYSVTVTNSQGSVVSSNAAVTVLPPSPPFFTYEPESATAYTGQNFQWQAGVNGSPPFTYQWRKDGTNVEEASNGIPGYASFVLTLTNVSEGDAGNYTISVTNDYGGIASTSAVLTVVSSVAPVITRQPRSLEVAEGVNTWMSLGATGVPNPWCIWTKADDIPPTPPPILTGQSQLHSFYNVTTNDAGIYFASVSNYAGGIISWNALLTVLPPIAKIGSWDQSAVGIFVTNGLAFLACGTNGLNVLDVRNPAAAQLLGSCDTADYALSVCVSDDLAFVGEGSTGLQIFSVTDPSNPVLVGGYDTPGYTSDVAVRSNLVYVADGNDGLLILDASNAASPSLMGSYGSNFNAGYVRLSGDYAVVTSPYSQIPLGTNVTGLFVIDVSDPSHPSEVGRLSLGVGSFDIRNQLVFGVSANSLRVITITNPARPEVIGTFNDYYSTNTAQLVGIAASDVRVENDLAFVAGHSQDESRLYVLEVRDPTEPIPVGYYANSGQCSTLSVESNLVYLAGSDGSLEIVQMPFNTAPVLPPGLSLSAEAGLKLNIHGRRGLHYDLQSTDRLTDDNWQTLQTILMTNDDVTIEVPSGASTRFFRLKQLD